MDGNATAAFFHQLATMIEDGYPAPYSITDIGYVILNPTLLFDDPDDVDAWCHTASIGANIFCGSLGSRGPWRSYTGNVRIADVDAEVWAPMPVESDISV